MCRVLDVRQESRIDLMVVNDRFMKYAHEILKPLHLNVRITFYIYHGDKFCSNIFVVVFLVRILLIDDAKLHMHGVIWDLKMQMKVDRVLIILNRILLLHWLPFTWANYLSKNCIKLSLRLKLCSYWVWWTIDDLKLYFIICRRNTMDGKLYWLTETWLNNSQVITRFKLLSA